MELEERAEEAEKAEDWQSALALWRVVARKAPDAITLCRYGRSAEKLGAWEEAEAAFSKAISVSPDLSVAFECMGALWKKRTDKDGGEHLLTARRWFLKALDRERSARILTFLGCTYLRLNETEQALAAFEDAIRVDANYEEALYNLGTLVTDTNPPRAIELFKRAIEIDPDYSSAHQELGRLYQQEKDLTLAEYHFRRSLEIDPGDYWTHLFLANNLGVQGRNAEAEAMYRFATSVHPELTGGLEFFARFMDSIGKHEEAEGLRGQIDSKKGSD